MLVKTGDRVMEWWLHLFIGQNVSLSIYNGEFMGAKHKKGEGAKGDDVS